MRLARDFYTNNKAANAAKSAAEKARKALLTAMQEAGLKDADIDLLTESGDMLPLRAYIDTPTTESISVEALRKHVSEEVFMKCVSATKKAVTEHAGSALATTCARPGVGTTNVHVEVRK
jgi:acyl CoA:acetate/3-ketoacid CoA transferase alpha subunit